MSAQLLKCPNCGVENRYDSKFCSQCATALTNMEDEVPKVQVQTQQPQIKFDLAAFITSFIASLGIVICGGTPAFIIFTFIIGYLMQPWFDAIGRESLGRLGDTIKCTVIFYVIAFFVLWWALYKTMTKSK